MNLIEATEIVTRLAHKPIVQVTSTPRELAAIGLVLGLCDSVILSFPDAASEIRISELLMHRINRG